MTPTSTEKTQPARKRLDGTCGTAFPTGTSRSCSPSAGSPSITSPSTGAGSSTVCCRPGATWPPPGRFFTQALRAGSIPVEVITDRASVYPRVLDELIPTAQHTVETGSGRHSTTSRSPSDPQRTIPIMPDAVQGKAQRNSARGVRWRSGSAHYAPWPLQQWRRTPGRWARPRASEPGTISAAPGDSAKRSWLAGEATSRRRTCTSGKPCGS
jgi:hypothetical protein